VSKTLSYEVDYVPISAGIFLFHPTIPGYPHAFVFSYPNLKVKTEFHRRFPGVVVFSEIYQGMLQVGGISYGN
jgi:hypothetical protein